MTRASNRLWQSRGSDYNLAMRMANAEFSLNHPAVCREGRALNIPHPIPYQGSKRRLARHILRFFPGNLARLVEPFAGSAAVSLAAAALGKAREFWINDINQPLMELWDRIINDPESISRNYEDIWTKQSVKEREYYDLIRREFNKTQHPDLLLFLLARCVKASVRYNSNHEFNQSPDNRRRGRKPDNMRMDILRASLLLRGKTMISCLDYKEVLAEVSKDDLVYMDPPYQGCVTNSDPRYLHGVCYGEFVSQLHLLDERDIAFIISYDGRTGDKVHGEKLPESLGLHYIEIEAGRSTQATLLGKSRITYESLYLSRALASRLTKEGMKLPESLTVSNGRTRNEPS